MVRAHAERLWRAFLQRFFDRDHGFSRRNARAIANAEDMRVDSKGFGAKGLAFIKVEGGEWKSPIVKFFGDAEKAALAEKLNIEEGDLILFAGGFFLLFKSTKEIFELMETREGIDNGKNVNVAKQFAGIIVQIALLDIVFSFDSILTAIGMTQNLPIMIAAIVISMVVMLLFSGRIAGIIEKHPSLQILALAFLILIGVMLIADASGYHVPKAYIYMAVGFSLGVELLNIRGKVRGGGPKAH